MTVITISELYDEVNILWNLGLNPLVQIKLIPQEPEMNPNLIYTNKNTVGLENEVVSSFEITYAKDGRVIDGNLGIIQNLDLTSKGYSSEFFFQQCAAQLSQLTDDFFIANGLGYTFTIEVYSDIVLNRLAPSVDDVVTTQIKVTGGYGSNCNACINNPCGKYPRLRCEDFCGCIH